MKNIRYSILFIASFVLFWQCSSSEKTEKEEEKEKQETVIVKEPTTDINLELNKLYAWVNLMPGDQPKFHITGDIIILNEKKVTSADTKLVQVKIFQNNLLHYLIKPTVRDNEEMGAVDGTAILFSTIRGLGLNPGFNYEKTIDVVLIFEEGDNSYTYPISDVQIDKAY